MITSFQGKYRFLSNFYPSVINVFVNEHVFTFPTVEHGYQCSKANNKEEFNVIFSCKTPGDTKKLAKKIKLRPTWDIEKYDIMLELVRFKFRQNQDLAKLLIDTGDVELIEGNTWGDVYWGVCKGIGRNNLGKILMQVRNEINEQTKN